jgi:hypothetical protein
MRNVARMQLHQGVRHLAQECHGSVGSAEADLDGTAAQNGIRKPPGPPSVHCTQAVGRTGTTQSSDRGPADAVAPVARGGEI